MEASFLTDGTRRKTECAGSFEQVTNVTNAHLLKAQGDGTPAFREKKEGEYY